MPCRCTPSDAHKGAQYDKFLAALFEECWYTNYQKAGCFFGWMSTMFWIFAQYPQIRTQFCEKRAEAILIVFSIQWLLGDVFNLISTFLLRLAISQQAIAVSYILCDTIMVLQIAYYSKCRVGLPPLDTKVRVWEAISYTLMFVAVIGMCIIYGTATAPYVDSMPYCSNEQIPKAQSIAGDVFGYITIPFYLSTRPIQIYTNCKRKTVENLNITMFAFTLCANSTYFIGIFLRNAQSPKELIPQIPFIVTSVVPMLLDCIILGQYIYYKSKDHKKMQDELDSQIHFIDKNITETTVEST